MIKYSIGNVDNWRVLRGWAFDQSDLDDCVTAVVAIDGAQVGTVACNLHRPDLLDRGLGTGNHGFELKLPFSFFDGKQHRVEVSFYSSSAKAEFERVFLLATPALVFLHMPKTGGTSFRSALEKNFPPHTVFPDSYMIARNGDNYPFTLACLDTMSGVERESIRLLRGHYTVECIQKIRRPMVTLTVLREPISRCVSHIWHIMRSESTGDFEEVLSRKLSEIANTQAKLLGQSTAKAIQQLRYFDFVGVTERLNEVASIIFAALGLPEVELPHANKTTQKALQDSLLRQKIAEANRLDQAVYDEASRICTALVDGASEGGAVGTPDISPACSGMKSEWKAAER